VRPWIEAAAQSFEKNQLGLSQIFFNSLRLAWGLGLLADSVCLLRTHALLQQPRSCKALLAELAPRQILMDIPEYPFPRFSAIYPPNLISTR
jgi:hypothetical protein